MHGVANLLLTLSERYGNKTCQLIEYSPAKPTSPLRLRTYQKCCSHDGRRCSRSVVRQTWTIDQTP